MTKMRVLAACAILLAGHAVANAKPLRLFKVANWNAGAYANDTTLAFSHCAASARYKSGVTVYFSINNKYNWSIGFSHPGWRLNRGEVYDIAFKIDRAQPIGSKAIAVSTSLVRVPLRDSRALFRQFETGERLYVATAGQKFTFKLTDSSKVLAALLSCVRGYVNAPVTADNSNPFAPGPKIANTNPFAGGGPSNPAPPISVAATRLEATTIAANLMAITNIKGFRLLSPEQASAIRVDAAWRAAGTVGTIRIISEERVSSLKNISVRLIGNNAKNCKGTFASGAIPEPGDDSVIRVFTACKVGDQATTIYYLALKRKQGGYYLFSTAAKGSDQLAKEADASIRQAVLNAIPK